MIKRIIHETINHFAINNIEAELSKRELDMDQVNMDKVLHLESEIIKCDMKIIMTNSILTTLTGCILIFVGF